MACTNCGACCGFFRVSFYFGETQEAGGSVPDNLTTPISPFRVCMQGTQSKPTRCVALLGDIGSSVRCTIYDSRSSSCRSFDMHGDNGAVNEDCNKARAFYGLPPLPDPIFVPEPSDTEIAV